MTNNNKNGSFLALLPFLSFIILFVSIGIWLTIEGHEFAFYQFPAASCALIAFGIALIVGYRNVNEHIRVFTSGIGEETVILMCLIFLLAGAFSTLTKAMGGVDATVNMGLYLFPPSLLLPGLFVIACFVSMAMGTSMGTIGTVVPIALGIAQKTGINPALAIGCIVGGSMFGDNLSVVSDTTIAATGTQGCDMRSKLLINLWVAVPAALAVTIVLYSVAPPLAKMPVADFSVIHTLPYLIVFGLALTGMSVIVILMIGVTLAAVIGYGTGAIDFIQIGKVTYEGFTSMSEVFFLTVLIAGLAAIATKEGGLDYLVRKMERFMTSKRSAETGIATLVSVADICIANNTVAILVTGGMVKKIASRFSISPARAAGLMDIFSCVWQGLIPFGAQLLLAGSLARLSPFEIIPFTWYPMALLVAAIISIVIQRPIKLRNAA